MSENVTRYRVAEGRVITPPRGLVRDPTGESAHLEGGAHFDVDNENPEIAVFQRYLRGRVLAGDLVIESQPMPTTASTSRKGSER